MFVKEDCIYLGRIIRTHGIHGQMILASEVSLSDEIIVEPFLVELDGGLVPFYLNTENGLKNRDHQSYLIKFDHVENKEKAEQYTNCEVYLLSLPTIKNNKELPSETSLLKNYAIYDANNTLIGKINDVLDFSGNTLIQLFVNEQEVMLPFTEAHILEWDNEKRKIKMEIPNGLLNL